MPTAAELSRDYEARARRRLAIRWVQCRAISPGDGAFEAFQQRYPQSTHLQLVARALNGTLSRADVEGGTTIPGNWAAPLVVPERVLFSAFIDWLRPATILGKLAARPAPINVKLPMATSGARARWVRQGRAVPLSNMGFRVTSMSRKKLGCITAFTEELLQATGPEVEAIIERDLGNAIIEEADAALVAPDRAATDDTPASLTHGVVPIPSSGDTEADIAALIGALQAANVPLTSAAFITSTNAALAMAGLRDPGGARLYPNLGVLGGDILGLPVYTSNAVGDQLILTAADFIYVSDEGMEVSTSDAGALEMDTDPAGDTDPVTPARMLIPLFQVNAKAVRALRYLNWELSRPEACAWVSDFVPAAPAAETRKAA